MTLYKIIQLLKFPIIFKYILLIYYDYYFEIALYEVSIIV